MEHFAINEKIAELLAQWGNSSLYASNLVIFCAVYLGGFMAIILLFYLFSGRRFWRQFRVTLLSVASGLLALYLADLIKSAYPVSRPFIDDNLKPLFMPGDLSSFPSSHAAFFGGLAFYVLFRNLYFGGWLVCLALLIGVARVAAGVHYPLDVVTGWGLGFLAALAFLWVGDKLAA